MVDLVDRRITGRAGVRRALGAATLALALTPAFAGSASAGPTAVGLGTAGDFALLAGSGLTNTGTTTIDGSVGSSATPTETGFDPCPAFANCVTLTGGTNHQSPAPNDTATVNAKNDLTTAYNDARGRTGGSAVTTLGGGATPLVPGVYTSASTIAVGGDLVLDGGGDPGAVFIFQAGSSLTTAAGITSGVPNTRVRLINSAQACNVFWQVGTSATIGTYTEFVGTILADQSVTVGTGATFDGRALARSGTVTLDTDTIRRSTCATPVTPPPTATPTPTPTDTTEPTADTPAGTEPTPVDAAPISVISVPSPTGTPKKTTAQAGTAKISGPGGAVKGPFTVTVSGRSIEQVVFTIDGKRVGTVVSRPGRKRFTLTIHPRGQSTRVHRVTARVTFTPKSRTTTTTLRLTYRRPPTAARPPQFTG